MTSSARSTRRSAARGVPRWTRRGSTSGGGRSRFRGPRRRRSVLGAGIPSSRSLDCISSRACRCRNRWSTAPTIRSMRRGPRRRRPRGSALPPRADSGRTPSDAGERSGDRRGRGGAARGAGCRVELTSPHARAEPRNRSYCRSSCANFETSLLILRLCIGSSTLRDSTLTHPRRVHLLSERFRTPMSRRPTSPGGPPSTRPAQAADRARASPRPPHCSPSPASSSRPRPPPPRAPRPTGRSRRSTFRAEPARACRSPSTRPRARSTNGSIIGPSFAQGGLATEASGREAVQLSVAGPVRAVHADQRGQRLRPALRGAAGLLRHAVGVRERDEAQPAALAHLGVQLHLDRRHHRQP